MSKNKLGIRLVKKPTLVILVFIFILASILYIIFFFTTLTWTKYTGQNVNFSFRYPSNLPVTACNNQFDLNLLKYKENVQFRKECYNQKSSSYGFIAVEEVGKVDDGVDFLKKEISFPGINNEYIATKVGNKNGYLLVPEKDESNLVYYFVFTNNLKFKIVFDKNLESEYKKILSTFTF